jgi:hypothetical protein
MIYRVHFPALTCDLHRDFTDRKEAEAFAQRRRDAELHMWRHVRIEEIEQVQMD